jgi:hypothetical protein
MEINGEFQHYMDSDTDTLWIGFALGARSLDSVYKQMLGKLNLEGLLELGGKLEA